MECNCTFPASATRSRCFYRTSPWCLLTRRSRRRRAATPWWRSALYRTPKTSWLSRGLIYWSKAFIWSSSLRIKSRRRLKIYSWKTWLSTTNPAWRTCTFRRVSSATWTTFRHWICRRGYSTTSCNSTRFRSIRPSKIECSTCTTIQECCAQSIQSETTRTASPSTISSSARPR